MSFFNKKGIKVKEKLQYDTKNLDVTIDSILLIMKYLGFINTQEIENHLNNLEAKVDKNILYRLRITTNDSEISELKKRFPHTEFGYGPEKIESLRLKLNSIIEQQKSLNKNYSEIVDELIFETKLNISRYENTLKELNSVIKRLNENSQLTEIDCLAMISYWLSYFKKEKLGFPSEYDVEIEEMISTLKNLEHGGYGETEIAKFRRRCKKELDKAKLNNISQNTTMLYIKNEIYTPLKISYKKNLELLEKRLLLISNLNGISQAERKIKKEEFIIDFNEQNGHKIDLSTQLLDMKRNLQELKYGGFSSELIDDFLNYAQNIIIEEKKKFKSDKTILALVRIEYNKSIDWYNNKIRTISLGGK